MTRHVVIIVTLIALNMGSAIAVVQSTQQTRELFYTLQVERMKHDRLNTEWAQLQLEDSAWASPDRVSQVARAQLDMIQPGHYVVLEDQP